MAYNNGEIFAALEDINDILQIFSAVLVTSLQATTSLNRKKQLNLLLLGKTGYGKSATGNSTLGRREFRSSSSTSSVTSQVTCSQGMCKDYVINIIDTPGLADTNPHNDKVEEVELIIENMEKSVKMSLGGIHAFLFVIKFGNRFTQEDRNCLYTCKHIFGEHFLEENGIVVFTHGDLFKGTMDTEDTPDKTFNEWCEEQRGGLADLMKECNNRCVLFNNRQSQAGAMKEQMEKMVGLVEKFESPYTVLDFIICQGLRNKLIVEVKLPTLTDTLQRDIDDLNAEIKRKCRFGNTSDADIDLIKTQIKLLTLKIIAEDRGTTLLLGMLVQMEDAKSIFMSHVQRQELARRRREEEEERDSCSIL